MVKTEEIHIGYRAVRILRKSQKRGRDLLAFGVEGNVGNLVSISNENWEVLSKLEEAISNTFPFFGGLNPQQQK